jgi:hypothetical protein
LVTSQKNNSRNDAGEIGIMTKDEKYVKKYFPNAVFYDTASTSAGEYLIFMLTTDGMAFSLIHGPQTEKELWEIARKIMDKRMLDKLAE